MTAIKNNGTAVAATEKANEAVTAIEVRTPDNGERKAVNIASDLIEPSNYNARKTFDTEALKELAQSISVHGLIQPITVRRKGEKSEHYKSVGLKENDYYGLTDEKKLQIASALTEEQKTVIRRDYLYSHLTDRTTTLADTKGGLLLAFSKQHLGDSCRGLRQEKRPIGRTYCRTESTRQTV